MVLEITNLRKTYDLHGQQVEVLRDVSLSLKPGESLALTGESGSGKSTLLHLAAALDGFEAGDIRIAGTSLVGLDEGQRATLRRDVVAVVFQQFNLIPSLTVSKNISLHARLSGRQDHTWEAELVQTLGLQALLDRYPEQLSGGQQQRVAIARAMALRPPLLLADEPTGNLDEDTAEAVLTLMLNLLHRSQTALFLVTHSKTVAARLDRRVHLRQGVLEWS